MNLCRITRWLLVTSCWPCSALPAAEPGSITVVATGEAMVKPDRLQIRIRTSATAELTADAVVKHREAARRARESFEKLSIEKLKIEELELGFSSTTSAESDLPQPPPVDVKSETDIHKLYRLTVSGIAKLSEDELTQLIARLLDAARDTGAMVEEEAQNNASPFMNSMAVPSSAVTFAAEDLSTPRRGAMEQAFRMAREKAQELAKLSGARLGPVQTVEEIVAGEEYGMPTSSDSRITSQTFTDLPIRVHLRVRFALQSEASQQ